MNQSENLDKLATALCAAQQLIRGAAKNAANPHFKSKFADLESILDAIREPMGKHGLSFVQAGAISASGAPLLRTTLLHASGQWIAGEYPLNPAKPDPQGLGACLTYARRYCIASMLGVPQVDDDGETASGRGETRGAAPAQAPAVMPPALTEEEEFNFALCAAFKGVEDKATEYCEDKGYIAKGQGKTFLDMEPMMKVRALKASGKLAAQFRVEQQDTIP